MIEVEEYLQEDGSSPFQKWFDSLNARAATKVTVVLDRIEQGNLGDVEPVGEGVSERRIDFGPGYRIYFGTVRDKSSIKLVILLCGGSKKKQSKDIETAKNYWKEYKGRKRKGES